MTRMLGRTPRSGAPDRKGVRRRQVFLGANTPGRPVAAPLPRPASGHSGGSLPRHQQIPSDTANTKGGPGPPTEWTPAGPMSEYLSKVDGSQTPGQAKHACPGGTRTGVQPPQARHSPENIRNRPRSGTGTTQRVAQACTMCTSFSTYRTTLKGICLDARCDKPGCHPACRADLEYVRFGRRLQVG